MLWRLWHFAFVADIVTAYYDLIIEAKEQKHLQSTAIITVNRNTNGPNDKKGIYQFRYKRAWMCIIYVFCTNTDTENSNHSHNIKTNGKRSRTYCYATPIPAYILHMDLAGACSIARDVSWCRSYFQADTSFWHGKEIVYLVLLVFASELASTVCVLPCVWSTFVHMIPIYLFSFSDAFWCWLVFGVGLVHKLCNRQRYAPQRDNNKIYLDVKIIYFNVKYKMKYPRQTLNKHETPGACHTHIICLGSTLTISSKPKRHWEQMKSISR